ncbi:MAG: type II toxin-antitoxin system VapC family toxin [Candidatus Sericytochromatia bacterium]
MAYLLDTHALIWFLEGNKQIPLGLQTLIRDPEEHIFVSLISFWEMAIKIQLGKLQLPESLEEMLADTVRVKIAILPLRPEHILALQSLPLHHRDPFDRILLAQSQSESLTLISRDAAFDAYGVIRLWER